MRRAVFLDRDGVINRALVHCGKPHPPSCLDELEILPGVPEALTMLRNAGFHLVVVTNQPDVARGITTRQGVDALHALLSSYLSLDEFRACYHDDGDHCGCRKPAPGMLIEAALENKLDLASSFLVGDRWRDVEAGRRAGCTTIFIDYDYAETKPQSPDKRVSSLLEAAEWILGQR